MRFFRDRLAPLGADVTQHAVAVLAALSLLSTVGVGAWFWQSNNAQDHAAEARDQASQNRFLIIEGQGKNLAVALDNQRAQFAACVDAKPNTPGCYAPAVPAAKDVAPQIITGPIGKTGPGPTEAQIAGAVRAYLAAHPAPAGKDGASPNPTQIAAQIRVGVTAYLTTNPPGAGADSTVPGPAGADVTDEQVRVAVASYCDAHDFCRGPPGSDGQPPYSWVSDGPGPSMTCVRDSPFDPARPTYHCATTVIPTPIPTPTPTVTATATPTATAKP